MRLRVATLVILLVTGFDLHPLSLAEQQEPLPRVTIGILVDATAERYGPLHTMVSEEIRLLLSNDFDVRLPADKLIRAGETVAAAERAIDRLLADPEVDLVIALGPVTSNQLARRRNLPKPAVAGLILQPEVQGLPPSESGGSGLANLNYLAVEFNARSLEAFREITPFTRVAVLAPEALVSALPEMASRIRRLEGVADLEPTIVPVGNSAAGALNSIDPMAEAVFVLPLPGLGDSEFRQLVQGFIERGLPSFSWIGAPEVRMGILAGRLPDGFVQRLARRSALNVQRILLGDDPASLTVFLAAQEQVSINLATAQAIGVYPPWRVFIEAQLIDDPAAQETRRLSLAGVVREALDVNLDLAAEDRFVAAGAQNVRIATAPLLPQVGVGADATAIDEDRAEASLGIFPQRSLTGSAGLSQVIYDERLWAGRSIEKSIQRSREYDRETLRLDVVTDAAVAYLSVLRAKTFERVQKENLTVTRSNLELAEIRFAVGAADASEVYRWQNQIANDRQAVIDALSITKRAEIEVRRILNRPLDEAFATKETDLRDPSLVTSQERLGAYLGDPWSFGIFQGFLAEEALATSPELAAMESLIEAQERALKSANRAFYLPALSLAAGLTNFFARGGASASPTGDVDDLRWAVGVTLTYPLFTGLGRLAEQARAREERSRLQLERRAIADRIEQRVRDAVYQMGASRANIDLSVEAAEAADRNYALVRAAYARGLGTILDVLDAQNQALSAQEDAATAQYDFLTDLMRVERAAGRFYFFAGPEDFEEFLQRLDVYFRN